MLSFREFIVEKREAGTEIYGWLNPKGSFIRNRGGDTHGDTYLKHGGTGSLKGYDYYSTVDGAVKKGWVRLAAAADRTHKEIDGVIQRSPSKWTPRHSKAWKRLKKAIGASKYKTDGVARSVV